MNCIKKSIAIDYKYFLFQIYLFILCISNWFCIKDKPSSFLILRDLYKYLLTYLQYITFNKTYLLYNIDNKKYVPINLFFYQFCYLLSNKPFIFYQI